MLFTIYELAVRPEISLIFLHGLRLFALETSDIYYYYPTYCIKSYTIVLTVYNCPQPVNILDYGLVSDITHYTRYAKAPGDILDYFPR